MRITRVSTAVVQGNFPWVLVQIETDEGITGLGEAYWGVGVAELVHKAGAGHHRREPAQHPQALRLDDSLPVRRGLAGRRHGHRHQRHRDRALGSRRAGTEHSHLQPLRRPLPRSHPGLRRLPCRRRRPNRRAYAERAREVVAAGFTAIKFDLDTRNPFTADISEDMHPRRQWFEPFNRTIGTAERRWMVSVVEAVRDAVGPDILVAMDCHWKFAVNDVLKLAWELEPYDLLWLEDPVPPENIDAQARVTANTRMPICTGENLYRKHGYRELIEKQAADIVAPDIPKMGGLIGGAQSGRHGGHLLHQSRAAQCLQPDRDRGAAHVCASIPNFLVIEFHAHDVPWWADLVEGEPPIRDGYILLGDGPGHGMTLNEDVARAHLKPGSSYFGDAP